MHSEVLQTGLQFTSRRSDRYLVRYKLNIPSKTQILTFFACFLLDSKETHTIPVPVAWNPYPWQVRVRVPALYPAGIPLTCTRSTQGPQWCPMAPNRITQPAEFGLSPFRAILAGTALIWQANPEGKGLALLHSSFTCMPPRHQQKGQKILTVIHTQWKVHLFRWI